MPDARSWMASYHHRSVGFTDVLPCGVGSYWERTRRPHICRLGMPGDPYIFIKDSSEFASILGSEYGCRCLVMDQLGQLQLLVPREKHERHTGSAIEMHAHVKDSAVKALPQILDSESSLPDLTACVVPCRWGAINARSRGPHGFSSCRRFSARIGLHSVMTHSNACASPHA